MQLAVAKRALVPLSVLAALALLVAAVLISLTPARPIGEARGDAEVAGDMAERAEEAAEMRADLHGRRAAQRILERTGEAEGSPVTHLAQRGPWDGAQLFGGTANKANDWEPAIGADPNSGSVYVLTTRFSKLCPKCGYSSIMLVKSTDGGHTFGDPTYLCKACNKWQYDPQISVDTNGVVHATMLVDGWRTMYTRSTDGGATWSTPVDTKVPLWWSDHGFLTISPDGDDLYVAMNKANSYVAASHDGGATWSDPVQTNPAGENLYYFHYNGTALNDTGEAYIAATGVKKSPYATGKIRYYMLKTTDGGATWTQILVGTVEEQPTCKDYDPTCRKDFYSGMATLSRDTNGTIVFAYAGAIVPRKGQVIFIRVSDDGGTTWSVPQELSPRTQDGRRVIASFCMITSTGDDDFRLAWQDNRNGTYRWNTYVRQSIDGGVSWGAAEQVSDATGGAGYKHPSGYESAYGDYLDIDVNNIGETVLTWGESYSYWGPGNTWINIET